MKLDYTHLLPSDFSDDSKVWIYQANRLFSLAETLEIEDMINSFVSSWNSHGAKVKGFGTVFFGRFIVLMADENATGVSGCSTDSSVRLLKEIEQNFNVAMFDRTLLTFAVKGKIEQIPFNQFAYAIENGFLQKDSPFFNNNVYSLKDFRNSWIVPIGESWLNRKIKPLRSA